jgi:hypothetical protein
MMIFQRLSKYAALLTLAGILAISWLFLKGKIEPAPMKIGMLILTGGWFAAAAVWMRGKN